MTELSGLLDALMQPLADPTSRTFWPWLLTAAIVALVWTPRSDRWLRDALGIDLWTHPSSRADLWMLIARRLFVLLGVLPETTMALAWGIALSRTLDRMLGIPELVAPPGWLLTVGYTLTLFLVWDLSRYVVHRLMHAVPALWAFHQVHHSAEVLTPLSFHRIHPVESAIYTLRGVAVSGTLAALAFWAFRGAASPWTILGAHGLGVLLNAATGNLRHSHVWLSFGPTMERWFVSPAQHQLHHSAEVEQTNANYGTWLAVWDRLGGTLLVAQAPPERIGLHEEDRNHDPHDLVSMLVRPMVASARAVPRGVSWVLLLLAWPADAQEVEDDETLYELIVEAPDGVPRVTGSAHRLDEEALERFEHDDIEQVLTGVPGVYIRTEDGLGLRPNIGMRGGNADRSARIALMEDGVPFAPAPYAAPAAYYFPMVGRVTAVEVFKGPSAIRHGPQTVGGALNLVTRDTPDDGAAAELDVAIGPWKTTSAHGWFGQGNPERGWLIEAAHRSTDGFKTLDTGGPTSMNRQDLMLKGRLREVELKLGYGHEDSWETYLGLTPEDFADDPLRRYAASDGDRMQWHRTQAELSWAGRLGERANARAVVYHHFLDREWFKLNRFADGPDLHALLMQPAGGQAAVFLDILRGQEDSTTADQALMRGTNARTFHSAGLQALVAVRHYNEHVYNELELGVRLHSDRVLRVHTERPYAMRDGVMVRDGALVTTLDTVTAADALAVYAHDELSFGKIELHPGLRTELVASRADGSADGLRAIPLPGLGLLVLAHPDLDVFGGLHRGFSPVPPGAPDDTPPEVAWSYELGLRGSPGASRLEAVGFFSDYTNLTGQCTFSSGCTEDQVDQQFDGGAATIYGLEALASQPVKLPGRLTLRTEASYTLTQAWFRTAFVSDFPQFGRVEAGDFLPYVPTHQGAIQLGVEHDRFALNTAVEGRSALRDEAGQEDLSAQAMVPGLVTVDASGSVQLRERLRVYLTATNLANHTPVASWRPFGARPVPPRQAMLGVEASL